MLKIKIFNRSFFILFIILSAFVLYACSTDRANAEKTDSIRDEIRKTDSIPEDSLKTEKSKPDTVSIIGVGDMMLGTNYPTSPNYLPPGNDCSSLLAPVSDILRDADLTFGNCEGVFSDHPEWARKCNDPRWCYRFSMPTEYVNCFVESGFDVVSIANNHLGDSGERGKKSTIKTLNDAGLHFAGQTTHPKDTFSINGIKYGFCAFAPNRGTCQITDYNLLKKLVSELDSVCDIVIVSFHGGAEGRKYEHVPRKYEHFLGQNRGNVYKFAHTAIDAGADVVFGHGPHVTRAVEVYKERFIAYSMGNFCTYRRFNIQGVSGIAPIVKLYTDSEGKFLSGEITATRQDKFTGTKLDPNKRVIKRMQELIAADFPESLIKLSDEGLIRYK